MPTGAKKSRIQRYLDEDAELPLPDVGDAHYLVNLLEEAGTVSHTGMGVTPLTWHEINEWLDCTELSLSVWEKLVIKEISQAYAVELSQATDKNRPPPYVRVKQAAPDLSIRLLAALRSYKKTKD